MILKLLLAMLTVLIHYVCHKEKQKNLLAINRLLTKIQSGIGLGTLRSNNTVGTRISVFWLDDGNFLASEVPGDQTLGFSMACPMISLP